MDTKIKDLKEFIEKFDALKKVDPMDLSSDQDLTFAIMNLISIEEHLYCTGAKTEKTEYYDMINEIRKMRKQLLKMIIKEYEGEVWCISKHLLAASMRLMEVGTKQLQAQNKSTAYELFNKAFELYTLFWAINMKILSPKDLEIKTETDSENNYYEINKEEEKEESPKKKSFIKSMGDFIKRAVNCCLE